MCVYIYIFTFIFVCIIALQHSANAPDSTQYMPWYPGRFGGFSDGRETFGVGACGHKGKPAEITRTLAG